MDLSLRSEPDEVLNILYETIRNSRYVMEEPV